MDQARRLFNAGSYDRAAQILRSEIEAHPQNADAHLLLGQIYALQGQRTDAIDQLTRAIERLNSSEAYNILGTALTASPSSMKRAKRSNRLSHLTRT